MLLVSRRSNSVVRTQAFSSHPQKHKLVTKLWKLAKRNAENHCKENIDKECALAWDVVNDYETSLRKLESKEFKKDPLDNYCEIEPDADECRTHDI